MVVKLTFCQKLEIYKISSTLTNNSWLKINKHRPGDMLARAGLTEEGVEGVITTSDGLVRWHLTIWLDAMLQAVQLPTGVSHLDSSLSDMDRDTLTLQGEQNQLENWSDQKHF